MATNKTETKTEAKVETKAETKKVVEDDGMMEITIPIDYANPDERLQYIAVNGVAILVPKGRKVKIKREYALAWLNTEAEMNKRLLQADAKRDADQRYTDNYINSTM